ncbi:MAG TPA: hypothetical protein PKD51_10105 [Saprospiraceae bacterium]|nr:hypothetical protein [Saprospiraceae bacterium]HMU05136.1 hypothetical protein [Saprospiraceae bacterium]
MAITSAEYKTHLYTLADKETKADTPAASLIALLDNSQELLFQGKEEIQPIKIYQISRIYKLARTCIDIITLIWPYLRTIIPLLKKIF